MLFLFIGAQFCGILVSFTGLPDMLGMLFWGGVNTTKNTLQMNVVIVDFIASMEAVLCTHTCSNFQNI